MSSSACSSLKCLSLASSDVCLLLKKFTSLSDAPWNPPREYKEWFVKQLPARVAEHFTKCSDHRPPGRQIPRCCDWAGHVLVNAPSENGFYCDLFVLFHLAVWYEGPAVWLGPLQIRALFLHEKQFVSQCFCGLLLWRHQKKKKKKERLDFGVKPVWEDQPGSLPLCLCPGGSQRMRDTLVSPLLKYSGSVCLTTCNYFFSKASCKHQMWDISTLWSDRISFWKIMFF